MPSLDHKIPPPIVGALIALAMWGASLQGPALAQAPEMRWGTAIVLAVVGAGFDLLGLLAFRRAHTTINPLTPGRTTALVTSGIYRVTRNPMYVGMGLILLAWAAYLSALLPFGGPVLYVLYITHFQIQPEERALRKLFGQPYLDYCARVKRWL